jgi:uncharacterized radical SAM superfamily protein
MVKLSAEAIWNLDEQELLSYINANDLTRRTKKISFYAPSFTYYKTATFCSNTSEFPTISVTGDRCALNCKHCGGKILETMHSAKTPESLRELCAKLKKEGARGILVSGGCLPDGSVPLGEFVNALSDVKLDLDLTVFVHTGIVNFETADQLKSAGVDMALVDVIGSDETIKEVYNLNTTTRIYEQSLNALSKAGIPFVPHVVTGLHNGTLLGELKSLQMIKPYSPSAIVIISFMPIRGTIMEKTKPPKPHDIARTMAVARAMFPDTPLVLGCMRPKGMHRSETDVWAIKAGVNGIAFPSEEAIQFAKRQGFEMAFSPFCCAQIYNDLSAKA